MRCEDVGTYSQRIFFQVSAAIDGIATERFRVRSPAVEDGEYLFDRPAGIYAGSGFAAIHSDDAEQTMRARALEK
jgi:hypothetical protein